MLRRIATLALALILAVTSVGFAVARGQHAPASLVELCTGTGTVMIALDAAGNPTGAVHLCPDAALFVAAGSAVPPPAAPAARAVRVAAAAAALPAGTRAPVARARGPPPVA